MDHRTIALDVFVALIAGLIILSVRMLFHAARRLLVAIGLRLVDEVTEKATEKMTENLDGKFQEIKALLGQKETGATEAQQQTKIRAEATRKRPYKRHKSRAQNLRSRSSAAANLPVP